ncbi:hypothetical protein BO82DRAFT_54409 [Aspergillus uvarum CBS 121591]|uniref:Uncharacterized protein n=1 Tax=Aspergillus uvarum CBS 121591 TaxID=1448315 RepID=A0A319CNC8_9EURO|nr:hypothetical protein BO82DRAFT_54409 [Aspergillus uvarum CBS 121591]PYH86935.1 hypothetical protein BO82DRAFT_54409 [Aspergillus uvarum CBS 121591]
METRPESLDTSLLFCFCSCFFFSFLFFFSLLLLCLIEMQHGCLHGALICTPRRLEETGIKMATLFRMGKRPNSLSSFRGFGRGRLCSL